MNWLGAGWCANCPFRHQGSSSLSFVTHSDTKSSLLISKLVGIDASKATMLKLEKLIAPRVGVSMSPTPAQPWFIAVAGFITFFNFGLAGESPGSSPAVARKDGFFGIHFDLHPNKSDAALGRDVTEENIRAFLRRVRPDFVQYDCVGVPGYSGYPTKVGWPAPGMVKDWLAIWRQVTREERVALPQSAETYWDRADNGAFSQADSVNETRGALHALLELHYSVDILAEHQLAPRLREFPVVVIPDAPRLVQDFRRALLDYVDAGGSLVLLGEECARLFEPALGVKFEGTPNRGGVLVSGGQSVSWTNGWQKVAPAGVRVIGQHHVTAETHAAEEPVATAVKRGKGRIAAVYGPVAPFLETLPVAIRELVGAVLRETLPQPAVEADAPATVDLALRRTRYGRLSVHFLNLAKVQRGENEFPTLGPFPAVGPFAVRLRTPRKPTAVRWEPGGRNVECSWHHGILTIVVPRLEIHGVAVIEGA